MVKFIIAMGNNNQPDYLDLSGFTEVKMVIKNDANSYDFPLLTESGEIDLKMGQVVFKIPESKFLNVKKIYDSGVNLFYIIGSNGTNNNVIYTGLFRIYDSIDNIDKAFEYFYNRFLILQHSTTPKLKIGVKRINETEAAIKNQEKTIKSKKKQILNEQEYLNTMGKIMTGESNFIDNKGKWAVATKLDVKEGLNPKIRRALKKSIIEQANKIKGTNIIMDF